MGAPPSASVRATAPTYSTGDRVQRLILAMMFATLACRREPQHPPRVCAPGRTVPCPCPGGAQGTQNCNATGTAYGACAGCPTCTPEQRLCGNACANVQTDNANCGACGNRCASGQTCIAGACITVAPPPPTMEPIAAPRHAHYAACGADADCEPGDICTDGVQGGPFGRACRPPCATRNASDCPEPPGGRGRPVCLPAASGDGNRCFLACGECPFGQRCGEPDLHGEGICLTL